MGPVSVTLSNLNLHLHRTSTAAEQLSQGSTAEMPRSKNKHLMLIIVKGRLTILWRSIFPSHPLPYRLPIQATEGQLHHPNLPPKYQLERFHLFRYSP
jgi:hypothetical protein